MQKAAVIPGRTLTTTEDEEPRSSVCTFLIIIRHIDKQHLPSKSNVDHKVMFVPYSKRRTMEIRMVLIHPIILHWILIILVYKPS